MTFVTVEPPESAPVVAKAERFPEGVHDAGGV